MLDDLWWFVHPCDSCNSFKCTFLIRFWLAAPEPLLWLAVQVEAPEPPKAPEVPKVPELPKAQKGIRVRKGKTTMMDLCGLSIPLKERALYFLKFGECYRWMRIDRGVSLLNVVKHNISQHEGSGRVQDIACTYSLRGCWVFRTEGE